MKRSFLFLFVFVLTMGVSANAWAQATAQISGDSPRSERRGFARR